MPKGNGALGSEGPNPPAGRPKTLAELIGLSSTAHRKRPPDEAHQEDERDEKKQKQEDEQEQSSSDEAGVTDASDQKNEESSTTTNESEEKGKPTSTLMNEPQAEKLPHSNVLFSLFDTTTTDHLDEDVAELLYPEPLPALSTGRLQINRDVEEGDAYKVYRSHFAKRRQRWKRRMYDFRSESDVGNAISNRVAANLKEPEEEAAKSVSILEDDSDGVSDDDEPTKKDDAGDNNSEHGDEDIGTQQSLILSQLLQGSQSQSQSQATQSQEEARIVPSTDNLNWWEMGYQAPRDKVDIPLPVPSFQPSRSPPPPTDDRNIVSMPFTLHMDRRPTLGFDKHQRFLLNARPDASLNLNRLWLALAARMVACDASTTEQLALLWKLRPDATYANRGQFAVGDGENTRQFTNQSLVEHFATHLGYRTMVFLQSQWSDRKLAAEKLTRISDTTPIPTTRHSIELPDGLSKIRKGRLKLTPKDISTTRYVHLPGTVPPIPQFPLDYDEILWGPSDRFQDVMHDFNSVGNVHEPVYKITLAALLASDSIETAREVMQHVVAVNQNSLFMKSNYAYPQYYYYLAVANGAAIDEEPSLFIGGVITDDHKLGLFRKLHLSYTLMSIAAVVPDDAAAFMEEESHLPPVEFVRTLLEDMIDYDECDRHQLENELNKHADAATVQKNPTDARWYAWRMAFLAGNLFLCGGGGDNNSMDGEGTMLSTLEEVRHELAEVLLLLEQLSRHHQRESACAHEAIQSLCEWRIVSALLFGDQHVPQIHELHRFHARRLREICMTPEIIATADSPCEKAFLELEKRPDIRKHWEQLVECLGPLGCTVSDHRNACISSNYQLLRDELHTRTPHPCWSSRDWWRSCLLLPLFARPQVSRLDAEDEIVAAIDEIQNSAPTSISSSESINESFDPPSIGWLDVFVFHIGSTKVLRGEELRAAMQDMPVATIGAQSTSTGVSLQLEDVEDHLAIVTCKILLYGHQALLDDEEVGVLVIELVVRCGWRHAKLTAACQRCVECLIRYGIDVRKLFLRAVQHYWNRFLRKA